MLKQSVNKQIEDKVMKKATFNGRWVFLSLMALLLLPSNAKADDIDLFSVGGKAAASNWPITVTFLIDTSGSMLSHNCEDCYKDGWYEKQAPNNSKICANSNFDELLGPDINGDGERDKYVGVYDTDGITWLGPHYKPLVTKGPEATDYYKSCSIWYTAAPYSNRPDVYEAPSMKGTVNSCGRGSSNEKETFDATVYRYCSKYSSCEEINRCVYSMRTQGYYSTLCGSGSGDPYNSCNCGQNTSGSQVNLPSTDDNIHIEAEDMTRSSSSSCGGGNANCLTPRIESNNGRTYIRADVATSTSRTYAYQLSTTFTGATGSYIITPTFNRTPDDGSATLRVESVRGNTVHASAVIELNSGAITDRDDGSLANAWCSYKNSWQTNNSLKPDSQNQAWVSQPITIDLTNGDTLRLTIKYGKGNVERVYDSWFWQYSDERTCSGVAIDAIDISSLRRCDFNTQGLATIESVPGTATSNSCPVNLSEPNISASNNCTFTKKHAYLGDWMNFNPRRDVQVSAALYSLFDRSELEDDIRIGITTYLDIPSAKPGNSSSNANKNLHYTATKSTTKDIQPSCATVKTKTACRDNKKDTPCLEDDIREDMKEEVYGMIGKFATGTPIAESIDHVGYFARKTDATQAQFCDKCQSNSFLIVLTDGEPTGTYDAPSGGRGGSCSATGLPTADNLYGSVFKDDGVLAFKNNACMDEVAYILRNKDLMDERDGVRNIITTYAISFALPNIADPDKCPDVLEQTAKAGDGICIPAYDVDSLKNALTTIIKDIKPRAMTYTAPSVAGVRGSGENTVVSTTFVPTNSFPYWEAHMYKFELCDELDTESTCTCADPDNNSEMCIVGADGTIVEYKDGLLASKPFWDAQLCLSGDYQNKNTGSLAQDPFHLNVGSCYRYADESKPAGSRRNIQTVVAANTDGKFDASDTQIEFLSTDTTNLAKLKTAFGYSSNEEAIRLIKFLRGIDVDDLDFDNDTTEERSLSTLLNSKGEAVDGWWKLGDIFHSSPLLISNLSDSFAQKSYRQVGQENAGFAGIIKNRPAIYVVGSNDGMIHAFHAGTYNNKGELVDSTGEELWAFIPPSVLPRLKDMCKVNGSGCGYDNKAYFIDASPTYRDVWIGSANDDLNKLSNKDKWKTVLIGGMRQGGHSYYALDVTDTTSPKFLWEFPPESATTRTTWGITEQFGETWMEMSASPSAVGAIQLNTNVPKWVALLGGGFDSLDQKGRGYYIVDPYTGELLYAAQYKNSDSNLKNMKYSFAAPPVFTWPKSFRNAQNDTIPMYTKIVAMDHGGQVWLQNLPAMGTKLSSGKISNWDSPKVVFRTQYPLIEPYSEPRAQNYQKKQIFFLPVTISTGDNKLRAIFGTGDRDQLLKQAEGYAWNDLICENPGYIYSVVLEDGLCSSTGPCTESDIDITLKAANARVGVGATSAKAAKGWRLELRPGERVVNPPSVITYRKNNGQNGGMVVITTYEPTVSCGRGDVGVASSCGESTGSNGNSRLYMLDAETGALIKDVQNLGGELPADPRLTTKVGATVESAILLPGTKENPTPTVQRTVSDQKAMEQLLQLEVPRSLHSVMHNMTNE